MKATKLLESELSSLKIEALPTRPTVPEAYGGAGFTASDMKRAFDRLPLFIAERLNALIDDILAEPESSVLASQRSGLAEGHTLYQMLLDIKSGAFSEYLMLGDASLSQMRTAHELALEELRGDLGVLLTALRASGIECDELYEKYSV